MCKCMNIASFGQRLPGTLGASDSEDWWSLETLCILPDGLQDTSHGSTLKTAVVDIKMTQVLRVNQCLPEKLVSLSMPGTLRLLPLHRHSVDYPTFWIKNFFKRQNLNSCHLCSKDWQQFEFILHYCQGNIPVDFSVHTILINLIVNFLSPMMLRRLQTSMHIGNHHFINKNWQIEFSLLDMIDLKEKHSDILQLEISPPQFQGWVRSSLQIKPQPGSALCRQFRRTVIRRDVIDSFSP